MRPMTLQLGHVIERYIEIQKVSTNGQNPTLSHLSARSQLRNTTMTIIISLCSWT